MIVYYLDEKGNPKAIDAEYLSFYNQNDDWKLLAKGIIGNKIDIIPVANIIQISNERW